MTLPVAQMGSSSSHGGKMISGSTDVLTGGLPTCRLGDLHSCPLPHHGVTPLVSSSITVNADGVGVGRVSSKAGCGAVIITGSVTVQAG